MGFKPVRLQTWKPGRYAKYWIVREVGGLHHACQGDGNADAADGTQAHAGEPACSQLERLLDESQMQLEAAQAERLRRGDREEGINRDSAWVKDMRWVRHFGERELIPIAEATDWLGSHARKAQARGAPARS
jgi:hypothetical protein